MTFFGHEDNDFPLQLLFQHKKEQDSNKEFTYGLAQNYKMLQMISEMHKKDCRNSPFFSSSLYYWENLWLSHHGRSDLLHLR